MSTQCKYFFSTFVDDRHTTRTDEKPRTTPTPISVNTDAYMMRVAKYCDHTYWSFRHGKETPIDSPEYYQEY